MNSTQAKKLAKHLTNESKSSFPDMEDSILYILTTKEVAEVMGMEDYYASDLLGSWREINTAIRKVSQWELIQPFPNEKWVFWNSYLVKSRTLDTKLTDQELATLTQALEAKDKHGVKSIGWERSNIGNYEHMWVIKYAHKHSENPRVSVSNTLLVHNALSEYVLSNGIVVLSFAQIQSMTGLSKRHIGAAISLLEASGLWFSIRGGKSGRGKTKFISLSHSSGHMNAEILKISQTL